MNPNDPRLATLINALRSGAAIDIAVEYAGIDTRTFYGWLERGQLEFDLTQAGNEPRPAENDYLELWEDLKKARADAIVRNVAMIQKAAEAGSWQAAAWWLERELPDRYGRGMGKPVDKPKNRPMLD